MQARARQDRLDADGRIIKKIICFSKCMICTYSLIFLWISVSFSSVDSKGQPACKVPVKLWFELYLSFNMLLNIVNVTVLTHFEKFILEPGNFKESLALAMKKLCKVLYYGWIFYGLYLWFSKNNDCGSSKVGGTGFLNTFMILTMFGSLYC